MAFVTNLKTIQDTKEELYKRFPLCFMISKRPLKIGIKEDLFACAPDIARNKVRTILRLYTDETSYLASVITGAERIDLLGKVVGRVTTEEAKQAAWRALGVSEARKMRTKLWKLKEVERAARRLIKEGLRTTPQGLIVLESEDKSDPHYELCQALELIELLNPLPVPKKPKVASKKKSA